MLVVGGHGEGRSGKHLQLMDKELRVREQERGQGMDHVLGLPEVCCIQERLDVSKDKLRV